MKHDVVQSIVQMEPQIFRNLVREVQETVATDLDLKLRNSKEGNPSFSILNLWNIRRNRRDAGSFRRKPRIVTGIGY
jgi:hypothetical protein